MGTAGASSTLLAEISSRRLNPTAANAGEVTNQLIPRIAAPFEETFSAYGRSGFLRISTNLQSSFSSTLARLPYCRPLSFRSHRIAHLPCINNSYFAIVIYTPFWRCDCIRRVAKMRRIWEIRNARDVFGWASVYLFANFTYGFLRYQA